MTMLEGIPYEIPQIYQSQILEPIRVICAGAGFSGLALAYKMKHQLEDFRLTVYEKNSDVGGTWLENRYPGCACDIPAHIYSYSWRPKPDWSHFYAGAEEIHDYIKDFYEEEQLDRYVQLNQKIVKADWDNSKGQYSVQVHNMRTGLITQEWCHVFVNCTGFLNKWRWPDIHNFNTFRGVKVHSANWDQSVDIFGKRVAVIGNGSSAIQIVPQLQKVAAHMKVFMRSPTWISPVVAAGAMKQLANPNKPDQLNAGQQFAFTPEHVNRFETDPEFHLKFRKQIEAELCAGYDMFLMGTDLQNQSREFMTGEMKRRLGPHQEILATKLIPTWPPGCRRITPGDGYLEALTTDNTECVFGNIRELTVNGLKMEDGSEHEFDILICATGFDVSFVPSFEISGQGGLLLSKSWQQEPNAYLGLGAPGFPNFFICCGPQGPVGNGSVIPALEALCDYFVQAIQKIQTEHIKYLQPKQKATYQLMAHMRKYHETTVWSQPCRSWYKDGTIDKLPQLWCGSSMSYMQTIFRPRWEDYEIEYKHENQWAFLGNGKVKAQVIPGPDGKMDIESMTPYIRNSHTPWSF
ncbi:hypothetical protein N7451_003106 [Penicillium sp. IBT 35674x]|nr:hypothetical protein N7451_003106 [Penicillium sp. IBT 35674x]